MKHLELIVLFLFLPFVFFTQDTSDPCKSMAKSIYSIEHAQESNNSYQKLQYRYKIDLAVPKLILIEQDSQTVEYITLQLYYENEISTVLTPNEDFRINCDDFSIEIVDRSLFISGCTLEVSIGLKNRLSLEEKNPIPGALFGDNTWILDTLVTVKNDRVVYDREICRLKCYNIKNQLKWSKKLTGSMCDLLYFGDIYRESGRRIKGCDLVIQDGDKKIYLINSRNGKMKYLRGSLSKS